MRAKASHAPPTVCSPAFRRLGREPQRASLVPSLGDWNFSRIWMLKLGGLVLLPTSPLFAQTGSADPLSSLQHVGFSRSGLGIVVGAIVVVVLAVFGWAMFIRKPEDDRPRRYSYPQPVSSNSA